MALLLLPFFAVGDTLPKPNILFILCDDLGYGDVRSNNPQGKIQTPSFDRLAMQGMRFTDAHSTSSVCTPTRYSILTGRYNWRSRLQNGVLGGLSPRLIEAGRLTVASLLKQNGYRTACIGKWHLGMDWVRLTGKPIPAENGIETSNQVWSVDFAKPFTGGPVHVGFDQYFGISASLDMVPYTYIEQDRVAVLPTMNMALPMNIEKPERKTRQGPGVQGFTAEEVLPTLTRKAVEYIQNNQATARSGTPFFLYLPLNAPHTPIAPLPEWRGKSGLNAYADFVMQTDDSIGQIMKALDEAGISENTLVIATSDNGCSPEAGIPLLLQSGHRVSAGFRGHKADIWDGGHRVPFIARWPQKIKAGSICDDLICLMDFMATCADIIGAPLPADAAEDSMSFLPSLLGTRGKSRRDTLVHHSIEGKFAIRRNEWKLCLTPGSGGWSAPKDQEARKQGMPEMQLYNMTSGISEEKNVVKEQPEVAKELVQLLEKMVADGRSTPGAPQTNSGVVNIWKTNKK